MIINSKMDFSHYSDNNGPRGTGESTKVLVIRHIIYWLILGAIVGVEFAYNRGLLDWSEGAMLWI